MNLFKLPKIVIKTIIKQKFMNSKKFEIEALVEDLIEGLIIEELVGSLNSAKECEVALEILIQKLEEFDPKEFKSYF